jgi:hypothetical protein
MTGSFTPCCWLAERQTRECRAKYQDLVTPRQYGQVQSADDQDDEARSTASMRSFLKHGDLNSSMKDYSTPSTLGANSL